MSAELMGILIKVVGEVARLLPVILQAVTSNKSTEDLIVEARAAVPQPLNAEAQALIDAAKARVGTP